MRDVSSRCMKLTGCMKRIINSEDQVQPRVKLMMMASRSVRERSVRAHAGLSR